MIGSTGLSDEGPPARRVPCRECGEEVDRKSDDHAEGTIWMYGTKTVDGEERYAETSVEVVFCWSCATERAEGWEPDD